MDCDNRVPAMSQRAIAWMFDIASFSGFETFRSISASEMDTGNVRVSRKALVFKCLLARPFQRRTLVSDCSEYLRWEGL